MQFIKNLYREAISIFEKYKDEHVTGIIIFYGPVSENPDLMIIGENPGGSKKKIQPGPEKEHDYKLENYKMAVNMKKDF